MDAIGKDKLQKYEHFLNDVLRSDLKNVLERRDSLFTEVAEYLELQKILDSVVLNPDGTLQRQSIRTKVDLGCDFYAQADITDLNQIAVNVGLELWVNMTPKEAKKFCEDKVAFLNKKVDLLTEEELRIKSQISMVYSALQQLQSL